MIVTTNLKKIDEKDISLLLKPSEYLNHLANQFNNMSSPPDDINPDDNENIILSKFHQMEEVQNREIPNKGKSLSLFHINACFLSRDFDNLQHLRFTN